MAKTPLDRLASAIEKELQSYADGVSQTVVDATVKVTKAGVRAIKQAAKNDFNGNKYWRGWTSSIETGKRSAQGVIYNRTHPGLAHLLEHGHAKRGGGRDPVKGVEHIAPVEEMIKQDFMKEVEKNL